MSSLRIGLSYLGGSKVTPVIPVIPAPTGLTATAESDTEISLLWTDNAESDSFTVQRSLNGNDWTDIANPIAPGWTDEGLTPETLYYYRVKSIVDGINSEYSTAANATTQATAPPPDEAVYIDPDNTASGRDGTIGNPYNSFVEAGLTNGTTYLWKGGTTYVSSTVLDLTNKTGIIIGQYGTEAKPKFQYTGNSSQGVLLSNCTNCTLSFIDVYTDLNNSLISLIQVTGGSGNIITNCTIHNVRHKTLAEGMGIRGGGTNLKILNCEVYDCGADGMYLVGNTNLEVGYCNIHHVNQDYAGAERGFRSIGMSAPGDGIQLDGNWSNYHIHHTTIDRTDAWTGNKFCLIQSSAPTSNTNSYGLVEYCTFKTRADNNVGWGIFAGFGDGITYRYNTFLGKTAGIRVAGPASKNYLIHHNVFKECTSGVGIAYNEGSPLNTRVFNNTFYKCSLRGIWVDRTTVIARNNIYYPDGAGGVGLHSYGGIGVSITQSNCCFENQETIGNGGQGDNAIIGNPLFVDAENGDYHLQAESPCRNSGIDVGLAEDYYGISIPQETVTAIGAAEYSI